MFFLGSYSRSPFPLTHLRGCSSSLSNSISVTRSSVTVRRALLEAWLRRMGGLRPSPMIRNIAESMPTDCSSNGGSSQGTSMGDECVSPA